ncbi:MAG: L,D-transpeptidase [Alphaproteobacteria bacterium]|nr:L,D-transpeptidase [Alphaproteobacteria bacterium]
MRRTLIGVGAVGLVGTAWLAVPQGPEPEVRQAGAILRVREEPHTRAPVVGRLAPEAAFPVYGRAEPTSGCQDGWGEVGGGWSCLDGTRTSDAPVRPQPRRIAFDPPTPEESKDYFRTGAWPRDPVDEGEGLLPFVYGKRWLQFAGAEHASVDDFLADRPLAPLGGFTKYAFTDVIETPKGTVLARPDGHVVPLDGVWIYPVTRFVGVDLRATSPPEGAVPAWAIRRAGLDLLPAPDAKAEPVATLAYHAQLWALPQAEAPDGWLRVQAPDGTGGWVRRSGGLRVWQEAGPPEEVADDELWVDVDLQQQILALRQGAALRHVTLVSTGTRGHETPTGRFRVMDKAAWWDMASLPESTQPYHLERVPWVVHFWPRYALHAAFWHDGFGQVVSHGCVNLAPRDAQVIFDALSPTLPPGWWTAEATEARPGTLIRVREGRRTDVPDRTRR